MLKESLVSRISRSRLTLRTLCTFFLTAGLLGGVFTLPAFAQMAPPDPDAFARGAGANQFAYVANGNADSVSGYKLDAATGALTAVAGSPFTSGRSGPSSVAADPAGDFLYVTNPSSPDNDIVGFAIDRATGRLTTLPSSPFTAGSGPVSIAIDPSGHFAYVANSNSNNVSAFKIDRTTGRLVAITGSPFAAGTFPSYVAMDPLGDKRDFLNCQGVLKRRVTSCPHCA